MEIRILKEILLELQAIKKVLLSIKKQQEQESKYVSRRNNWINPQ